MARRRILILGAGFGGIATALALNKQFTSDEASVLLVDRSNAQLFTPLLWTVADGRASAAHVVVPIRAFQRGRSFHILYTDVERIDLESRQVTTSAGVSPYDVLVIALGSIVAVPPVPGLGEHCLIFHSPADAIQLRNHIIDAIEKGHQAQDPAERRAWLTFVVAGGGDTGVELAATIHDYATEGLFATYPWLADTAVRVVLVEREDRLTPMGRVSVSEMVRRVLTKQGVEVQTGTTVEGVTGNMVHTSRGEIPTHTLFWSAGITAPPPVRELPVEHARNGSLLVDDHLRIPGHPEVYVVGDSAWAYDPITGAPVPPTAQAAEHQGNYVAQVIAAALQGGAAPVYRYSSLGHLTLLGQHTGVAEIGPFTVTGMVAWLLWHTYYVAHIPAWRNRFALVTDWLLAALFGRDTAQLPLHMPPVIHPAKEATDKSAPRMARHRRDGDS